MRMHAIHLWAMLVQATVMPVMPASAHIARYVVLGPDGAAMARAITDAPACPAIRIDGARRIMHPRAVPETIALRPTQSDPAESKPSAFPVLTCERVLPHSAHHVSIAGMPLPLPARDVRRIVVIGDTGCRLKRADQAWQACGDPAAYPFARIAAAAAAWKPDLVVHVGDYEYRENACPADQPQCAGSAWGYGWDAWNADFFTPAAALLAAAPWAVTRGNHESCARAGQGWWRFLDPRALVAGRDCNAAADDGVGDYSEPYAIPLGRRAQLLMLDTSIAGNGAISPTAPKFAKFQQMYRDYAALAARASYNIAANHQPLLGFTDTAKDGVVALDPGNRVMAATFGSIDPAMAPANVQLLLSGHVHVWEQVSFSSGHPSQFITGFSGTQEDTVQLPAKLPPGASPAPGAVVAAFSSWVGGFGWMTMQRTGPDRWNVVVRDVQGRAVNRCAIVGKVSHCDVARVL